jgi:hypothetical protein
VRRCLSLAVAAIAALGATSCGSTSTNAQTTTTALTTLTTRAPLPAGPEPSAISKEVCASKAQKDIALVLGVNAVVQAPTWVDHLYACRYQYPDGSMVLSVKELSSWSQTKGYFAQLGTQLGNVGPLGNLGQGAFTTTDGSVVVRKDWKVLLVNISGLPARFGVPPTSAADVADTVADVILGCWAGD